MPRILSAFFAALFLAFTGNASSSEIVQTVSVSQACRYGTTPPEKRELIPNHPKITALLGKSPMCIVKNTSVALDVVSVSVGQTDDPEIAGIRIKFSEESKRKFDDLQSENVGKTMVLSVKNLAICVFGIRAIQHLGFMQLMGMNLQDAKDIRSVIVGTEEPAREKPAR